MSRSSSSRSRSFGALRLSLGLALLSLLQCESAAAAVDESSDCVWHEAANANLTLVFEMVPVPAAADAAAAVEPHADATLRREAQAAATGAPAARVARARTRRASVPQSAPCLVPLSATQSARVRQEEGSSATLSCFVLLRADHTVRNGTVHVQPHSRTHCTSRQHAASDRLGPSPLGSQVSWWRGTYRYPLLVGRDRFVPDRRFRSATSPPHEQLAHSASLLRPTSTRLSVQMRAIDDWSLVIDELRPEDSDSYSCHVNSRPPRVRHFDLRVLPRADAQPAPDPRRRRGGNESDGNESLQQQLLTLPQNDETQATSRAAVAADESVQFRGVCTRPETVV